MHLSELQRICGEDNRKKGFVPDSFPTCMMLVVGELGEAVEEERTGHKLSEVYYSDDPQGNKKPEGVGIEIADALIRLFHWADTFNIDLEALIQEKLAYNRTRPQKHGKVY